MNFKNFKLVQRIKDISPKLKWAMFSKIQDCKIVSRYIDYLIPEKKDINKDNERIQKMVIDTLVKEFSPKIKEFKIFNTLVETAVHNIKMKHLKSMGNYEDIEL